MEIEKTRSGSVNSSSNLLSGNGYSQPLNANSVPNGFCGISVKYIANDFFAKCEEIINKERKKATSIGSNSISGMGSWFAACVPKLKPRQSVKQNMPDNFTPTEEENKEVSIKHIIDSVILQATNQTKLSFAELLLLSPETRHFVKQKADCFVSCSHDQTINSLIESLDDTLLQPLSREKFTSMNQNDDVFVYIDFLCQNQWTLNDIPHDKVYAFYSTILPNAIEGIGSFLLLLDGSDNSPSPKNEDKQVGSQTKSVNASSHASDIKSTLLKKDIKALSSSAASSASSAGSVEVASYESRSAHMASVLRSKKCLWELYCAASARHKSDTFVFKLSHRNERSKKKMIENAYCFPEPLLKDFARLVRFEKSVSSSPVEDSILNQVMSGYGISYPQVNQAVFLLFSRWMVEACQSLLYKLENSSGKGDVPMSFNGESSMEASTMFSSSGPESYVPEVSKSNSTQKAQKRKVLICSALSVYYEKLDDPKSAELYHRKLVVETEKMYGPLVRHTAMTWHSLAHFLAKKGKKEYLVEAISYYSKALEYCKNYGETERVPVLLNDIALCQKLLGAPEKSIPLYLEALQYWQLKGPDSTEIATCMSNLANCYAASGNLGEALRYHTQSLHVVERLLGSKHPQCAKRLVRIARIQFMLGSQSIGNELVQRALLIYQEALGPESPEFQKIKASVIKEIQQPSDAMETS